MKQFAALLVATLLVAGPATAIAAGLDDIEFDHNGSVMWIDTDGESIEIYYDEPRSGLPVKPDQLLFEGVFDAGTIEDGEISGDAYLFKSGCDPAPYAVEGTIEKDGVDYVIELTGPSPRRDGCKVVGYDPTSPNATLVFESDEDDGGAPADDAGGDDEEQDDSTPGDDDDTADSED